MALELGLSRLLSSISLLIITLDIDLRGILADKTSIDQHLDLGKNMLAAGQLADALSHYHAAVELDTQNYMTYFRRATVYLAMGKSKSALPDLQKVIELKPDFIGARVQRANVLLKQGKYDLATDDYTEVLRSSPHNPDALHNLEHLHHLPQDIEQAEEFISQHNFSPAIDILSKAIEISPWDPTLREMRAECYIHQGDYFKAIQDTKTTAKLVSDNTAAYLKVSKLHYEIGEAEESLIEIRECLKLDPDHKECFPFYKNVKKLVKQIKAVQDKINSQQYEECVEKARKMLKIEPKVYSFVHKAKSHICHCQSKTKDTKEALASCDEVLEMDENNIEALCDKAEAYIADEQLQEAINTYQKATGIDGNYQRAQEGLNKAQKLFKQSQKRDYYKILGVKRNAQKPEIQKAYRKLAVKWHPDKYDKPEEKKKAEEMFINIAAAKEVLSNPEKRQKFDNGEDPLDAEQQAQGGNGFNPFGNDGYSFKFHFN